ncbi:MAG: PfkB family carbohydrate kinase [Syntrophomonadaceae bacterium]|jgi:pseudouridine kinase
MRLTTREREIVEVLKKEPLISQDDLAQRFHISRSSIAVHISNLMKKGVIAGKGYVFNEQVSVVVVGECCTKVSISTRGDLNNVDINDGGFATEVSEALSRFGVYVKLITVTGNDDIGLRLVNRFRAHNIDISNIYHHPRRSCRLVLVDNVLVYREGYTNEEYREAIEAKSWVASNCEWLIVEDQFQEIIFNQILTREHNIPKSCTCKYVNGPQDIPDVLSGFSLVVIGVDNFDRLDGYINRVNLMIRRNDQHFVVTDGKTNITCVNQSGVTDYAMLPTQNFSVQSKLPLLMTGIIYGLISGYPLRQAFRIGAGTASSN